MPSNITRYSISQLAFFPKGTLFTYIDDMGIQSCLVAYQVHTSAKKDPSEAMFCVPSDPSRTFKVDVFERLNEDFGKTKLTRSFAIIHTDPKALNSEGTFYGDGGIEQTALTRYNRAVRGVEEAGETE